MRMSCNGCRVLRKGCSEDCTLRPSLQWIQSSDSQSHATLFLAKFYGRAGLLNLINAGPTHQRPDVFKSLLYEACGRIINPVYGSAGLMSSGDWNRCQAAVEAVLNGVPLSPGDGGGPHGGCDIRHARARGRKQGKRRGAHRASEEEEQEERFTITGWEGNVPEKCYVAADQDMSHDSWSVETVEPSMVNWAEQSETRSRNIGLDLTLGRDPGMMHNYLSD